MKLTESIMYQLNSKLPDWAIKQHPTKSNMSVIHPMAVIERLNDVFGVGGWQTKVVFIKSYDWMQQTKTGERKVYTATCQLIFDVEEYNIHLEQFGGSTNDDEGDAMKGSATDALTKIASYLNIGAEIYKGNGNIDYGSKKTKTVVAGQSDNSDVPF
jgi:hypothetical protein